MMDLTPYFASSLAVMIELRTEALPVGTTFKIAKRPIRDEFLARLKKEGEGFRARL